MKLKFVPIKTRSEFDTNLKTIWLRPKRRCPPAPPRNRTTLLRYCTRSRRSSSENVGKTLPNLPFDVQLNIISRLSAKLIFVCKSLSKAFNAAISEPSFTRIYHNNYFSANSSSSLNPIFINSSNLTSIHTGGSQHIKLELVQFQKDVYTNDSPIISEAKCFSSARLPGSFRRGDVNGGTSIWGQCNGLCCLLKLDNDILNLFLTNPLSGEFIKLPDPVKCDRRSWWRSIMAYGLSYCQTTERYKVLRIVTNYLGGGVRNYDIKTEILTIGVDKKWRDVSDVNVPFNIRHTHNGPNNPQMDMVALRSTLHWKVRPIRMRDGFEIEPKCGGRIQIAAFDMTEERVCALPFPPVVVYPSFYGMGVLMDKLCLWDLMIQTDDINIWIMDDYGVQGSWTKQFNIKFSRLPHGFLQEQFIPLSISVHDGVILVSDKQRLVYYNLKTNYSLTCIHLVHHKDDISYPMPFVPDFVSFRNRQGWIAD